MGAFRKNNFQQPMDLGMGRGQEARERLGYRRVDRSAKGAYRSLVLALHVIAPSPPTCMRPCRYLLALPTMEAMEGVGQYL